MNLTDPLWRNPSLAGQWNPGEARLLILRLTPHALRPHQPVPTSLQTPPSTVSALSFCPAPLLFFPAPTYFLSLSLFSHFLHSSLTPWRNLHSIPPSPPDHKIPDGPNFSLQLLFFPLPITPSAFPRTTTTSLPPTPPYSSCYLTYLFTPYISESDLILPPLLPQTFPPQSFSLNVCIPTVPFRHGSSSPRRPSTSAVPPPAAQLAANETSHPTNHPPPPPSSSNPFLRK